MNVADLDGEGFADAQAAVIHEAQGGAKAGLDDGLEEGLDFSAGQDGGQDLGFGDADFLEHGPTLDLDAVQKEGQEGILGGLHRGGLVVLVLAQKENVLADLVFGEDGRIALEMLGQLTDLAARLAIALATAEHTPFWWRVGNL